MKILSFNLGSSSLKCAVHEIQDGREECLYEGSFEPQPRPRSATDAAREAIAQIDSAGLTIDAIGHRFVFGGRSDWTAVISEDLLQSLEDVRALDPLHGPQALAIYHVAAQRFSEVPQYAVFDTEFFRDLPAIAQVLPIPHDDPLLRRYGFHGLSYEYVVATLGENLRGRAIVAHLGSGSSLAAFADGKPVDTSMGFSPLGGVLMASRPGDLDPGVLLYLLERHGFTPASLRRLLETQSGLLTLGGTEDMRELSERAAFGEERAAFAVACFVRSVSKMAGALAAVLGGLDTLVFTGGIGEHDPAIRSAIGASLEFLGVQLDAQSNAAGAPVVSTPPSKVTIRVVGTDENLVVARHVVRCRIAVEAH